MQAHTDCNEDGKWLCQSCVSDDYLLEQIRDQGQVRYCSYCDDEVRCLELNDVAGLVDKAFESHYQRTASEPDGWEYAMIKNCGWEWDREGEEPVYIIADMIGAGEDIAEDIRQILKEMHSDYEAHRMMEECEFNDGAHYELKPQWPGEFAYLWNEFELELTSRSRFFSKRAYEILHDIFVGIENHRTSNRNGVIIEAGPHKSIDHLFRARVFRNEKEDIENALCFPWKELSPPPWQLAGAGRMNPSGISVFYGAKEPDTAISEVRPPVGSWVVVARFNLLKPLRLLDLSALDSIEPQGSLLDPATLIEKQRISFLETLVSKLAGPVLPHEQEFKYLPTQAVAEFLTSEFGLDGIKFPSVQAGAGATNVVLFHHASEVLRIELPKGAKVSADMNHCHPDETPDGFTVWEKLPKPDAEKQDDDEFSIIEKLCPSPEETTGAYLSIDLEGITCHRIESVSFQKWSHDVARHRSNLTDHF